MPEIRRPVALLLLALAACSRSSPEAPPPAPAYPELEALVPAVLEKDRIPGAVIVAGTADRILVRRAFGSARLETVFDLASLTKVVGTTTAVLRLVEEGRMSLAEPIGTYVPAFKGRDITVEELLTHRSGLPAYLTPRARTPEGILEEISELRQEKKFRYS